MSSEKQWKLLCKDGLTSVVQVLEPPWVALFFDHHLTQTSIPTLEIPSARQPKSQKAPYRFAEPMHATCSMMDESDGLQLRKSSTQHLRKRFTLSASFQGAIVNNCPSGQIPMATA